MIVERMPELKLRTLIIDDEPLAREAIRTRLTGDGDIKIVGEASNGKQAIREIQHRKPDLVFLDVQMPDLDGFRVLSSLGPTHLPIVVFVTAYEQHALRAFEVHALDYILKPFDDERFQDALSRAKSYWRRDRGNQFESRLRELLTHKLAGMGYLDRMIVRETGRISFVKIEDIKWFRAEGNYVKLFVGKHTHMLHTSMNALEARLDPRRFFRIHRSLIINVEHLQELRPWHTGEYIVVMRDGTELTMSRGYRDRLDQLLSAFR
jgi:two-component system LytT family response regulator